MTTRNEEIVKEWLAEEANDSYVCGELYAKTLDGCFDFEELIKRLDKECEERVREERERMLKLIEDAFNATSHRNEIHYHNLMPFLTTTKTDKTTEV